MRTSLVRKDGRGFVVGTKPVNIIRMDDCGLARCMPFYGYGVWRKGGVWAKPFYPTTHRLPFLPPYVIEDFCKG
jgi:hypothetical protein